MALLQPGHFQRTYFSSGYWQTYQQYFPHFLVKAGPFPIETEKKPISLFHKGRLVLELKAGSDISFFPKETIIETEDQINITVESLDWILMIDEDLWLAEQ